ncbi:sulfotransferase family protein [Ruegeria arenilitoris]|uniref:sulfotransferase family protein n=1 Tax=Ruegeria arenilitoris TaxID=1173585 RepID=UPI00147EA56A|nr:sulfotransferase [Ruegeria arenilitoris]
MHFKDINFIIIGAGKSASTWLQKQLQSDPEVYMPDPELHYFSRNYSRGDEWYLSQFKDAGVGQTVGEKSNSYLYAPDAAAHIHDRMPHVRLIAQLRNPVERAYSNYCMLFQRGEVGPDIESYLDPSQGGGNKLLISGHFASHLQTYIDLFGREKLLILFFEGVLDDPEGQMSQVRTHLDLPPHPLAPEGWSKTKDKSAPNVPAHWKKRLGWMKPIVRPLRGTATFETARGWIASETQYPPLTDDLRKRLNDYYGPSIEALEQISGQSLSHWYGSMDEPGGMTA